MALSRQNIQGMEIHWFLVVGTRKTCVPLSISRLTMLISHFHSGLRKERALVCSSSHQFTSNIYIVVLAPQSFKTLSSRTMLGGPRLPIFISISGTSTSKNSAICSLPSSFSSPLGLIRVVTSCPNSTPPMVVEFGSLAIVL